MAKMTKWIKTADFGDICSYDKGIECTVTYEDGSVFWTKDEKKIDEIMTQVHLQQQMLLEHDKAVAFDRARVR